MDATEIRRAPPRWLLTLPRRLPSAAVLLLAFLIAVGMPLLRQLHEAEHSAHQSAFAARGLPPGPVAGPDDDCGACALCQLFAVAAAHQALVGTALDVPVASAAPVVVIEVPHERTWAPGLMRQPPARGPPASRA
jgi:hypothetical protein